MKMSPKYTHGESINYVDDNDLIRDYNNGVIKAFDEVYYRLFGLLRYYALNITREEYLADEVISDVFLNNWLGAKAFESYRHLKNALSLSAKNRAINLLQSESSHKNRNEKYGKEVNINQVRDNDYIESEVFDRIVRASNHLSPLYKNVFDLLYIKGYTNSEIASELMISQETVKSQKLRLIIKLKNIIVPHYCK